MPEEKIKVVVDTNVFIHGMSHRNINSVKILKLIEQRRLELFFSQETIGELVWIMKNFVRHNIDDRKTRITVLQNLMTLFYYGKSVNT
jgi:predicted nucleic acid-binding protein